VVGWLGGWVVGWLGGWVGVRTLGCLRLVRTSPSRAYNSKLLDLPSPVTPVHAVRQSSSRSKLLLLPPQPVYVNLLQRPADSSQAQRSSTSSPAQRTSPASAALRQSAGVAAAAPEPLLLLETLLVRPSCKCSAAEGPVVVWAGMQRWRQYKGTWGPKCINSARQAQISAAAARVCAKQSRTPLHRGM